MGHAIDYWPEPHSAGKQLTAGPDQVEFALWTLVQAGGNQVKAVRMVLEQHPEWEGDVTRARLRGWVNGRFKARYEEIRKERYGELEALVAARATDMAIRLVDVEEDALRRVHAGLANADGVGASLILRNLSQSKGLQIEKAGQLRGQAAFGPTQINLTAIVGELESLGISRTTAGPRRASDVEGEAHPVAETDPPAEPPSVP